MLFLRIVVATLPQLMVLLLLGGWLDLLGGLNNTDAGLSILMFLFLANPVLALMLLFVEVTKHRKLLRLNREIKSSGWVNLSIALFIETLMTNLLVISQIKM